VNLLKLIGVFLKIGAIVFGGGFVAIPFLEQNIVVRHGWLSHREFTDAIAMGQVTPGPILISAVFIGYRVAGFPGAVLATLSVFLPSFLMVVILTRQLIRFRKNPYVRGFLKGVAPAVVALLLAAAWTLGKPALTNPATAGIDPITAGIAVVALVALIHLKMDASLVIVASAILGAVLWR